MQYRYYCSGLHWLLVSGTGRYRTKRPMNCDHFIRCASASGFLPFLIHPPEVVRQIPTKTLSGEAGITLQEVSVNFTGEVSLSYSVRILRPNLTIYGADGFTSPPKEAVLRILLLLEIHRPRPGLNPRTLGSVTITITTRPPRTISGL
jgi:hypothetical protein